jgi:uncharacterized repeat protein (TIGR03803 family)
MPAKRLSLRIAVGLAVVISFTFLANRPAAAQVETLLDTFKSVRQNGQSPNDSLIFDKAGNLYGTTFVGGRYSEGTAFELTPNGTGGWNEKVLHSFGNVIGTHSDGTNPVGPLTFDSAGNLYGTTSLGGGTNHYGIVFELLPKAGGGWTENILRNFNNNNPSNADGIYPQGNLVIDSAGNVYGTTPDGGIGSGVVYELIPAGGGRWTEKVLHSFDLTDGKYSLAGLVLDAQGNLYGTTNVGGAFSGGVAFELSPSSGGTWTYKLLYSFGATPTDGLYPAANLIFDSAGNLYGTDYAGGAHNLGTVFELSPIAGGGWSETTLYSFGGGTDGNYPESPVTFDSSGNLYGTTTSGGASNVGVVFKLTPSGGGTWTETLLHTFTGGSDGANAFGGLILDNSGNLYGTTYVGGGAGVFSGNGTVFEITP